MKKWKIISPAKPKNIEEIIDVLITNRGIKTKKEREDFLSPKLADVTIENVGIDKSSIKKTIERISQAIKKNETIVIYGDYDVDGISGTAILWETLYAFYKNVIPYIPHRVDEGYGLSSKGISNIKSQIAKNGLIITVDNGIVAGEAVEFANKNGFDVIITDHHVRSEKAPKAIAIVHTTKLCGAGVAYLLAKEISNFKFQIQNKSQIQNTKYKIQDTHLELVALATVADLVPLTGANRTIVKFGLESLRNTKRPGLLSLFEEAKISKEEIDVYKIGHIIAPRINAAGRIAHGLDSLRLICTKDPNRAKTLARILGETNIERRTLTEDSALHADSILDITDQKIIFAKSEIYEQGIIGLVASRLVEKHYRPSIVVSIGDKVSKGSARSISGFNIIEFLRTFDSHFINAGGHPMAAGFTIETTKLEAFGIALAERSDDAFSDTLLERVINIDLELGFDQLNLELVDSLQQIGPFGMGNPEPVFMSKNVKVESVRPVGKEGKHLKLVLSQNGKTLDAILFNAEDSSLKTGTEIDLVYVMEKDTWNGNSKIQLKIKM